MKKHLVTQIGAGTIGLTLGLLLSISVQAQAGPKKEDLPLDDLQRFTSVVEHIRSYYVKPTDDHLLFENAIRGMLSGLDPHSSFFDPEEYTDLKEGTSGKFGGLGIEVTMEEGFIRVISPIDNTPASKSGIASGDLVVRIDDTPVKGLSLKSAVDMMRGERGTAVILTVMREGEDKPLTFEIVRDIIEVESIRARMLDDGFGYIRISQFQEDTGRDMRRVLEELLDESKPTAFKGLVIDLRNNPGGIFDASVDVVDAVLDARKLGDNKKIVYAEGRLPGSQLMEKAHAGDMINGAPIVVLVNGGSASASEIVAGALQDHRRAIIMGTQTFGKGSVQTVLPLGDAYGLKLTTALYFTPNGRSIQATGIKPDIMVPVLPMPEPPAKDKNWMSLKESDLQGHLNNALSKELGTQKPKDTSEEKTYEPIVDYQLNEALNLLKGLSILGGERG